jgi:N-methylhydantoinase B
VLGGRDALPFRITLNPGPGERAIRGKETLRLALGDVVLVETCGGGGYGPPGDRAAELIEQDRRDGYL